MVFTVTKISFIWDTQPLRGELNAPSNITDIHQVSAAVTRIQCDVRQGIESWLYTIFAPFQ